MNIFAELIVTILHFIAIYIVFGKLHRPQGRWKKVIVNVLIFCNYPILVAGWLLTGDNTLNNILGILMFLLVGWLCRREGDRSRPIISALYLGAIFVMIAIIITSYAADVLGIPALLEVFGVGLYVVEIIESTLYILWAIFYYHVSRKMSANVPLSFLLLIVLMPLAVVIVGLFFISSTSNTYGMRVGNMLRQKAIYSYMLGFLAH